LKRARLKKGLGLATISAVCILAGCSVAREQARLTYDPAKVVPNAPRATIEAQIGSPDHVSTTNGLTEATYTSSRVSAETKQSLVANREVADLFLVGGGELLDPFGASEDETKIFVVLYGSDQRAQSVRIRCRKGQPQEFVEVSPKGFSPTCTPIIKG
jgi:hypothetical protein